MLAHKLKTIIPTDHRLTVEIPDEVPAGPAEVTLLVTPIVSPPDLDQESSEDAQPEELLEQLRELVAEGQLTAARHLTVEASRRFPNHKKLQWARHVFSEAEATPNPFVQPTTAAEIDWLDHPPKETHGKWVALVGSELIGLAETLDDLMKQIEEKNLQQLPLVQQIAA